MTKDFKRSTTGHSDPGEAIELPMFDEALSSTNQWKRIFRPSRKGIVDNLKDFKTKESSILVKNENDEYFLVSK
jgi:hypothetical protein